MAESLEHIALLIKKELEESEAFYRESLKTDVSLLEDVIDYIIQQQGKKFRPLLILLSAAMTGNINQRTHLASTAIEMLHTATLVHDDVVDDADQRRGMKSVNAVWQSKVAVLVGDYLLAQALMLVTQNKAYDLLEIITLPIRYMSEGELLQIEKSRSLDITEDTYFEIINKKTAALIAASAATGAKSVGADDKTVEALREIGEMMGMAFQIKDDIFDFQKIDSIGKPTGNDIIERKITLPLIYALNQVEEGQQKEILKLVNNAGKEHNNVELVRDFVNKHKGIEYAVSIANQYRDKAIDLLKQSFSDSPVHHSMIELAYYITERNK